MLLNTSVDDVRELTLLNEEGDLQLELLLRLCSVNKAEVLRNDSIKDQSADSSINNL